MKSAITKILSALVGLLLLAAGVLLFPRHSPHQELESAWKGDRMKWRHEMDRYVRAIMGFREAVMLSLYFSDGVDFDFLDQSVRRLVVEHEFRGVLEVGYAELVRVGVEGETLATNEGRDIAESDAVADLAMPVRWRWTRWGHGLPPENLFTEDYIGALTESAKHRRPFFADGICFVSDEAGEPIKRGVRLFVPVFRTLRPEEPSSIGLVDNWERDYVGSVFATINLDPLLTVLFDDPRRLLELELFHGSAVAEGNRVSGFKTRMDGLPLPAGLNPSDPLVEFVESLELYGVEWTLRAYATEFYKGGTGFGDWRNAYVALSLIFIGLIFLSLSLLLARRKSVRLASGSSENVALDLFNTSPEQDLSCWQGRKLGLNQDDDDEVDDWVEVEPAISGRFKLLPFLKPGSLSSGLRSVSADTWIWTGLVLGVGVILTGSLFAGARSRDLKAHQSEFEQRCDAMWSSVESRIEKREQAIQGLHQFMSRHGEQPFSEWRDLWREFQDRMAIEGTDSELIEFGFGRIVDKDDPEGAEVILERLGQEFGVDLSHLEPILKSNGTVAVPLIAETSSMSIPSAVGVDLMSAPGQQKLALALSEQGLRPRISSKILLPIEKGTGEVPVFRMFITLNHPVIRSQEPMVDISQDSQRAWGFVYGTFSLDVMLASLFGSDTSRDVEMEIFVGARHSPELTLTAGTRFARETGLKFRQPAAPAARHGLEQFMEESQYLQPWWIRFYSTDSFNEGATLRNSWWTLYAGLALTFCLGGLVFTQSHGRDQAERLTLELNDAQSNLAKFSSDREIACKAIHDQVIQSIFAVSIGLKRMSATVNGLSQQEKLEVDALAGEINGSLQQVTRDLRHLSWKMEPAPYGTDVKVAIESMCDRLRVLLGIQIRCNIDSDAALKLSGLIDSVAPIVQEGISNACRHGHTDHVEVSFKDKIKYILIIIKDDGIGFEPYKCSDLGQGLKNMRSRIEALGGQMEIIGKFGIGTELHFSILHEARV